MASKREGPLIVTPDQPAQIHRRHLGKYAVGDVGQVKSFYFRNSTGIVSRACNLFEFLERSDELDDASWLHHLTREDFTTWFRHMIKDDELADLARGGETRADQTGDREALCCPCPAISLECRLTKTSARPVTRPVRSLPVPDACGFNILPQCAGWNGRGLTYPTRVEEDSGPRPCAARLTLSLYSLRDLLVRHKHACLGEMVPHLAQASLGLVDFRFHDLGGIAGALVRV